MCDDKIITRKAYAAMHVMQWRQTDKDSYRVSADRQRTWAQLCLLICVNTVFAARWGTWEYLYLLCICERGLRNGNDRECCELSCHGKYMSQSVKDGPTCYRKFTWWGLHPSNQEPSEPHITLLFTYSAHDWKSYQTLQKSIATPHTVISTFRFLCVQFIPLKSSQLK